MLQPVAGRLLHVHAFKSFSARHLSSLCPSPQKRRFCNKHPTARTFVFRARNTRLRTHDT
eukprot:scaffold59994_cov68-Phaeocystis_antarctica.AAC.3